MKELEKEFETIFWARKFIFTQIARQGDVALYSKRRPDWSYCSYEVIIVQKHNGFEVFGRKIPPAEYFPSSNEWGTNGFTYQKREDALCKYNQLIRLKCS
jgi:hypothetical protein